MGREVQEVAKPTTVTPLKMEDAFPIFHLVKMILHILKCNIMKIYEVTKLGF
jgi:hypothetical protein